MNYWVWPFQQDVRRKAEPEVLWSRFRQKQTMTERRHRSKSLSCVRRTGRKGTFLVKDKTQAQHFDSSFIPVVHDCIISTWWSGLCTCTISSSLQSGTAFKRYVLHLYHSAFLFLVYIMAWEVCFSILCSGYKCTKHNINVSPTQQYTLYCPWKWKQYWSALHSI